MAAMTGKTVLSPVAPASYDATAAGRLWDVSAALVGLSHPA
jgi:hypothetical protein